MIIVMRPIVPQGNEDFFEQASIAGHIGRSNALPPLTFYPQGGTNDLRGNTCAPRAANIPINLGADFGCICYEWIPGRSIAQNVVIWIGHGAKIGGPQHFPGIPAFHTLACYCLTAAAARVPLAQNALQTAPRPEIDRIRFFSCRAMNWAVIHLPVFITVIHSQQTRNLQLEVSTKPLYSGRVSVFFAAALNPTVESLLSHIRITAQETWIPKHETIRLSWGNAFIFGNSMLLKVFEKRLLLVRRGWHLPANSRIAYHDLKTDKDEVIGVPHAPIIFRPVRTPQQTTQHPASNTTPNAAPNATQPTGIRRLPALPPLRDSDPL